MTVQDELLKPINLMRNSVPFKLFGLQRSGTNLARLLLLQNFEMTSLEIGYEWKHGLISPEHRNWIYDGLPVCLVICIKNPYAWLVSCYNYFQTNYHADPTVDRNFKHDWNFEQFVKSPSYNFKTPVDRWNNLTRHWLEFPEHKQFTEVILHESMLDEMGQKSALEKIEKSQSLIRKNELVHTVLKRVGVKMHLHGTFNYEYYQKRQYLAYYSDQLLDFVNCSVDTELFKTLGYVFVDC